MYRLLYTYTDYYTHVQVITMHPVIGKMIHKVHSVHSPIDHTVSLLKYLLLM